MFPNGLKGMMDDDSKSADSDKCSGKKQKKGSQGAPFQGMEKMMKEGRAPMKMMQEMMGDEFSPMEMCRIN